MKYQLSDRFDNGELNHFTHYDYLLQVIENGQFTAFKEHLELMSDEALVRFLTVRADDANSYSFDFIADEILKRMKR